MSDQDDATAAKGRASRQSESRGLRYAALGLIGVLILFGLLVVPENAPLRNPETGDVIGNSPFMNALIVPIMFLFLFSGIGYGLGAGND